MVSVLVTGASGLVGSKVVELLHKHAKNFNVKEIRALDIKDPTWKNQSDSENGEQIDIRITADVRDYDAVNSACSGINCVIHCAAVIDVRTNPNQDALWSINVGGTKNMVKACLENQVEYLVYVSSVDVVGGGIALEDGGAKPKEPITEYAKTKVAAERMVLDANGSALASGATLKTISIRPNTIYGEGDKMGVLTAMKNASFGSYFLHMGVKDARYQLQYSGNVAWMSLLAFRALAKDDSIGGDAYPVYDDTPETGFWDIASMFAKERGLKCFPLKIPFAILYLVFFLFHCFIIFVKPIYQVRTDASLHNMKRSVGTHYLHDVQRAKKMLNYEPIYSFEESFRQSSPYYCTAKL